MYLCILSVCVAHVRRAAGAGAVLGAGAADVGQRLRLLPRPRRGPLGTVRLRILTVTVYVDLVHKWTAANGATCTVNRSATNLAR